MRSPAEADGDPFARIAPYYDELMGSVPYALWADYVCCLAAIAERPIEPGANLLDLATGTGSVALQFAARGCRVTGIDVSKPMLLQARRKAAERGLPATFLCSDLSDFHLSSEFDFAVCLYDSLNYILEICHLKRAFANIRAALRADGLLIFDVNTLRALEAELFTQESPPGVPIQYRWKSRYDPATRTTSIKMHFVIQSSGESIDVLHRQRAYSEEELRQLLSEAGFAAIETYDAYRVAAPRPQSDRIFFVARAL